MNKRHHVLLLIFFFTVPLLYPQEKIISFNNNLTIDLSLNYRFLQFDQENIFGCRGDKPVDLGIRVRYKKISLGLTFELPFFSEFYNPLQQSYDLNLDYLGDSLIVNTFFSRYNSFIINNNKISNELTDSNAGLDVLLAGVSFRWVLRPESHSLRGVYKLDRRQTISGGSPVFGFGIYYHSIYSADNKLPAYETRQHFIYTGPLAGYSYTWIFGSGGFFNIDIGGGINPALNTNEMKFVFIPVLFPSITLGCNFRTWSLSSSLDINYFIAIQSYEVYSANWHQLNKMHITLLKISKRF